MKHRMLRALYVVFGLAPAMSALVPVRHVPFAGAAEVVMLVMPVCGVAGLAIACLVSFPARGRAYWIASGLLTCGIVALAPAVVLWALSFGRRIEATALNALLLAGSATPLVVAFHFIFRAQDIGETYGAEPPNDAR